MLSEERVRTMTKMQIFVDHEGDKTRPMVNYFRWDYLGRQIIISVLSGTLAFVIGYLLFTIGDIETLIIAIDFTTVGEMLHSFVIKYGIFMLGYLAITLLIYSIRYARGRKKLRRYYAQLQQMEKLYQEEEYRQRPTGGMEG